MILRIPSGKSRVKAIAFFGVMLFLGLGSAPAGWCGLSGASCGLHECETAYDDCAAPCNGCSGRPGAPGLCLVNGDI
jgi:hypothetical protein